MQIRSNIFILSLICVICIYGFIILYSASGGNLKPWALNQIIVFCVAILGMIILGMLDTRIIYDSSYLFYFLTLLLLIIVFFIGKSAMGARRWINLGLFTIQPSELIKISLVAMLAKYFHQRDKYKLSDYTLIIPLILSLIPILFILKQPDLGTAIIVTIVVIVMFFAAGINLRYFIVTGVGFLISIPLIWSVMHQYQRNRILTFMNPEQDPLGNGYNIIQSKIAIGSGGMFGKGFLNGTQGQLSFLPEYHTDFIFAFLCEEFGFFGGIILLVMYLLLIIRCILISVFCNSEFTRLLTIGITTSFASHIFINIGMNLGLLPVVGIPLSLISYGRTIMVSTLIGFGLIVSASFNKKL